MGVSLPNWEARCCNYSFLIDTGIGEASIWGVAQDLLTKGVPQSVNLAKQLFRFRLDGEGRPSIRIRLTFPNRRNQG
jgi:hypothetical protein